MINTDTLGIVCKLAAVAAIAVLGYCLVNFVQHIHIAEMYKVAGTF